MNRGARAALVGVAVALTVGGCGGGSEAEPLTRVKFIEQGDSICRQAVKERDDALRATSKGIGGESSSTEAELERFVAEVALPSIKTMTDELDDLGVPKKDEEQVEAIVEGFEDVVAKMESDPRNVLSAASFTDANERAESYGLMDCRI